MDLNPPWFPRHSLVEWGVGPVSFPCQPHATGQPEQRSRQSPAILDGVTHQFTDVRYALLDMTGVNDSLLGGHCLAGRVYDHAQTRLVGNDIPFTVHDTQGYFGVDHLTGDLRV